MKIHPKIVILSMALFAQTSIAGVNSGQNSISSCTDLLPTDNKYHLVLETNINPKGAEKELVWNIEMDDGSNEEISDEEDDRRDKEIELFIKCIMPLIQ